ncbi:glycine-rich domain-containing protein [Algoriphagus marincola]|uniref:glycine-rich domain-containing protein n=1 Tax=Algoriphagus marincola TaxID=264027 RepID=UPI0006850A15|nr:SUMF1/EgtB/PvdO family nonheme iron enzyme [Algoriphagus marincola]
MKFRESLIFFCLLIFYFFTENIYANNIQVSNVTVTGQNLANDFTKVQFDISWENSWRINSEASNWDAAWVFVKFQVGTVDPSFSGVSSSGNTVTVSSTSNLRVGMPVVKTSGTGNIAYGAVITAITGPTTFTVSGSVPGLSNASIQCKRIWEHATLNTSSSNHTSVAGTTIDVTNDGKGIFIHRDVPGIGDVNYSGIQLRWDYGIDGVLGNHLVSVKVFAIEMVYVPQGAFYVGDGTTTDIRGHFRNGSANTPLRISSEGELTLGGTADGNLANSNNFGLFFVSFDDFNNSTTRILPETFPKGYAGFYSMKYELSQGQYRDFLNTLTYEQQGSRTTSLPSAASRTAALVNTNRNGIQIKTTGIAASLTPAVYGCNLNNNSVFDESNDGEWIACNFITWIDGAAYLDWAGLRPMTELEYEKAARGVRVPVANEYAWGSTVAVPATGISNSGAINELPSNSTANIAAANQSGVQGPLRVGAFSRASSSRVQSGASYWGIMDLSGNLFERTVSVGHVNGRAYTGTHGDGRLSVSGNANVTNWPGMNAGTGEVSNDELGLGLRGADGIYPLISHRVSDRELASNFSLLRNSHRGIRGVRSAECLNNAAAPVFDTSDGKSPVLVLPGQIVNYKVTGSGSFRWMVPQDWQILSGQGTNDVTLIVGSAPADIRVAAYNDCGFGAEATAVVYPIASGGDEVYEYVADGTNGEAGITYRVHKFTTVGSSEFTSYIPLEIEYLIIGGGGGGGVGGGTSIAGGGGGAGGYRSSVQGESSGGGASAEAPLALSTGTYPIVVGAGGIGGQVVWNVGARGGNSSAFGLTSIGGGGGGTWTGQASSGGSGGGAGENGQGLTFGNGTSGQGFRGGDDIGSYSSNASTSAGAGGGGAGSVGRNAISSTQGGSGGVGLQSYITGQGVFRAGGGGGAGNVDIGGNISGPGGIGGGGAGRGGTTGVGRHAEPNTGGGGGGGLFTGGSGNAPGGNGGSGIVIIRYRIN